MSSTLVVFEKVGTNRRILVNFGQVCKVEAGGVTTAIHYSDGSSDVVRASFDEVCAAVDIASVPVAYADAKAGE
jgi:hypothetical protein